jgi:hypothetical protein
MDQKKKCCNGKRKYTTALAVRAAAMIFPKATQKATIKEFKSIRRTGTLTTLAPLPTFQARRRFVNK